MEILHRDSANIYKFFAVKGNNYILLWKDTKKSVENLL